ncbi:N-formyl-4-amino-5-aminomethyl-2-methylpyrimidinedeformylase [Jeotgalicoccus aerolatus]|uniref:Acetylornithine deacetylase/succinyl-diaminopimelate desuccinylase-like protein n=1 Tax=Jeotgalicoccus aerolatus TaxID=709510 RepID=A0ABS4HLS5_9STAP|nr:M20/M25/M40 family metallo-hydrolase [Jeotgalicoccus aerolatus]MBP1951879.1 acetylornithine deacetylase/succinyl-diaminopimelate desuccinylase-like protein [Jeotgalicoccus aerolatus]GGD94007.1 peptidase M20 [Jeotgalicoccus aerolatus]CAD2074926.1 N-formyl-4-amino-5-aminomethyl-2-methylpyrimidinedeformylase [Jeotgalicoccus aerolatus]
MTFEKMDDFIRQHCDDHLDQLFNLLKIKSISADTDEIRNCANVLKVDMESLGIHTEIIETAGNPVVYGEILNDKNRFTLLIYGHYDVQAAEPLELWDSNPFEPEIRDGRIYARGVGDNKGQLMAQLLGLKTYQALYGELPINVKFIFEGEEELGSVHLAEFVENHKKLLEADLVYTSDGSSHNSGNPLILLGVRGVLTLEMTAKGADFDNHSGNTGNIVPNPAWKMVELLNTMRDDNGKVLVDGFYDHIREPSDKEIELLKQLPYDQADIAEKIGYKDLDMDGASYYHKLTMEPTFNIAGIESGYTGKHAKTIIPASATVNMDIRLVADQDPEYVFEKIEDHVKKVNPDVVVTYKGAMRPSRTPAELEIVQVVTDAVGHAYGKVPLVQPSMPGSLPDYVWTEILNTPSIIMPYANFDQHNHSPNENLKVENFLNGIKCTCNLVKELGEWSRE